MGDMAMEMGGMSRKRRHAREVWRANNKRGMMYNSQKQDGKNGWNID